MEKCWMIMDGQWGSTGKGLLAGYLSIHRQPDTAVCNFGPNAGHTTVLPSGKTVIVCQLPSAIVSPYVKNIMIGPGSIIDINLLQKELEEYTDFIKDKKIWIHENAILVHQLHKKIEKHKVNCISSTCKGTGAAIANRVMRDPAGIIRHIDKYICRTFPMNVMVVNYLEWDDLMGAAKKLQIESAQGFELSIDGPFYPHCTSRPINKWQILSDCGIPGRFDPELIVSMRCHPIRVGHAYDKDGVKIGDSGPVYDDQNELTFEGLNVQAERTTVTGKIRRIFTWSWRNFQRMVTYNDPDYMFLNFVNYIEKGADFGKGRVGAFVNEIEEMYFSLSREIGSPINIPFIKWIGTGPNIMNVKERPTHEPI